MPETTLSTPLPTFTPEQLQALKAYMIELGKARAETLGGDFHEADFLAGCMATFFALDAQNTCVDWIFGTMAGDSPLGVELRDQTVYAAFRPALRKSDDAITLYVRKDDAYEHVDYLQGLGNDDTMLIELRLRRSLHPRVLAALEARE